MTARRCSLACRRTGRKRRAVLGQIGVYLVGEMGRHPTALEAIRRAEERFPEQTIAPTAIYAFWHVPVERFCSAVEFHKRCLPNSFIQLSPERFVGIEPHPRWFETDPEAIAQDLRTVIASILPLDILGALPPPSASGVSFQPRGGNLSLSATVRMAGWRSRDYSALCGLRGRTEGGGRLVWRGWRFGGDPADHCSGRPFGRAWYLGSRICSGILQG
jgi:hypothetical protein